ncbi:hypothetical protein ACFQ07_27395 [Actinomadura adrarensis]|uniref:SMI1/KNR4 family protein n=1 Tax=Actinomadura adrarensis TaxID=1819600 RepID=A0ABW3CN95_9ACTN
MPRLTEAEYLATMGPVPERVGLDESPPFDFWPYFDSIPRGDFGEFDFSAGEVGYAWNMPSGCHQHVLIRCETPDVFLVLVLDLPRQRVHGHHLLDLGRLYGTR